MSYSDWFRRPASGRGAGRPRARKPILITAVSAALVVLAGVAVLLVTPGKATLNATSVAASRQDRQTGGALLVIRAKVHGKVRGKICDRGNSQQAEPRKGSDSPGRFEPLLVVRVRAPLLRELACVGGCNGTRRYAYRLATSGTAVLMVSKAPGRPVPVSHR